MEEIEFTILTDQRVIRFWEIDSGIFNSKNRL